MPTNRGDITNPLIGFHGHLDTVASAGDDLAFVHGDVLALVRDQQGGEELVEGPSLAIPRTLRRVAGLEVRGGESGTRGGESGGKAGRVRYCNRGRKRGRVRYCNMGKQKSRLT